MIKEYEKIIELSSNSQVDLAQSFKELMHKKLQLGQSRYVCRNGTLSEGHEKILESQRYLQAIKEAWHLSMNIILQKAVGMEGYADLLEGEEELFMAKSEVQKLRSQAKILKAKQKILSALTTVEDQSRQLDEYLKIEAELKDSFDAKYPEGIEQAEPDHWRAIAEYRAINRTIGIPETMKNIPMSASEKAKLGLELGCNDMTTWYLAQNKQELLQSNLTTMDFLKGKLLDSPKLMEITKEGA